MKNPSKQKHTAIIADQKSRGEWAEMRFLVAAAEHGLQVNKTWGEMSHYDFVTGHEGRLVRVQVKSTISKSRKTGYLCTVRGGHRPYVGDVFDFIAAYIVPEDIWYIIPRAQIYGRGAISLYPHATKIEGDHMKYEKYKEAWPLLRAASANSRSRSRPDATSRTRAKPIPGKLNNLEARAEETLNPSRLSRVGILTSANQLPNHFVILSKPQLRSGRSACLIRAKTQRVCVLNF